MDAADGDLLRRYLFTYDRAGNRLSESLAISGGAPTVTNFTYNAANQMTSNGSVTFGYDNNGNLITANSVPVMTWDRANRLLSATDGVTTSQYAYDGEGHRIQQTVGATITKYLLDLQPGLSLVLAETVGANTKRFVHGPMGIHAQEDAAGVWTWGVQDALGNVRLEASNAVAVNGMRNFAPYGVGFGQQGNFSMPYGFTGEPGDGNGLNYHRARYYSPALGVFPSLDPFEGMPGRPMSLNGYSWVEGNTPNDAVGELLSLINGYNYANGNPVNMTDPSGMIAQPTKWWNPSSNMVEASGAFGILSAIGATSGSADLAKILSSGACEAQLFKPFAIPPAPLCCPEWLPAFLRRFFYCRDCAQTSTEPAQGFIPPYWLPQFNPGQPHPDVTITEGALGAMVVFSVPCMGFTSLLYRVTTGPFVIESMDAEGGRVARDFNCDVLPDPQLEDYSCQDWRTAESVYTGGIVRWAISAGAAQIVAVTCNGVIVYERYPAE